MQQLRFAELDDQGRLVLEDDEGTRYALPVDDRVRAALRPRRVGGDPDRTQPAATPREVQAMIRAGQSAEEVAAATGWELVRVQRFEGPVLAEREHVVGLAQAAAVRAHGRTDGSHTLDRRVRERLQSRGVSPSDVTWDAARTEAHGPWTVLVIFEAGGRERRATWHYEVADRALEALDDEARWLSEDEQALPGGLAGHPLLGTSTAEDETNELMATMRARRQRRQRRATRPVTPAGTTSADSAGDSLADDSAAPPPGQEDGKQDGPGTGAVRSGRRGKGAGRATPAMVDEVLPLEDLEPAAGAREKDAPDGALEKEEKGADEPGADEPQAVEPVLLEKDTAEEDTAEEDLHEEIEPEEIEPEEIEEPEESVEGVYARTRHDPYEVSFDEFFGTDDDYDDDEDFDEDFDEDADDFDGEEDHGGDQELDGEEDSAQGREFSEDPEIKDGAEVAAHDGKDQDPAPEAEEPGTGTAPEPEPAEPESAESTPEQTQEAKPGSRRKGRPSVPSWDDIMFGASGNKRR